MTIILLSVRREAPRLLHDVGHGHTLVENPQLPVGSVRRSGVHEDAAVLESPVHISHHGADVPATVGLTLLLGLDVLLDGGVPPLLVSLVDGVDLPSRLALHVGVREDKLSNGRVEHEAVDAVAGGEDDHGGAAVQSVTRRHDLPAGLEGVARGEGPLVRLLEDGKDGADGDEAVNVGAAVQGVKRDDVLALPLSLHLNLIVVLLTSRHVQIMMIL